MTDDTLVVNFVALEQASSDIGTAIATIGGQLDELERDAAPLVARWGGEARDAYAARQARWQRAAADLTAILRSIQQAIDESAADYLSTERRNASLFG